MRCWATADRKASASCHTEWQQEASFPRNTSESRRAGTSLSVRHLCHVICTVCYVNESDQNAVGSIIVDTYSKSKYASVIAKAGGWGWFQKLLVAMQSVGEKHGVSISNVAAKWTLDKPSVPAIIVGARNARHIADHQVANVSLANLTCYQSFEASVMFWPLLFLHLFLPCDNRSRRYSPFPWTTMTE